MKYGELWSARLRLLRPGNALMAALGVLAGMYLVDPSPSQDWIAAPAAAFLITAFGNVLNDVRDVELDKIAHPERPLASGALDANQARLFAGLLLTFGLWEAYVVGTPTLLFALANTGLLLAYEFGLKSRGLLGNIAVASLVASTFAFGAVATGAGPASWGLLWALIATAWLTNLARELLKDVEDLAADHTTRRTFPMAAGAPVTLVVAFILVNVAVVLSAWAWFQVPGWWGLALLVAAIAFQFGAAAAWVDVRFSQRALKGAMLMALLAFLLS